MSGFLTEDTGDPMKDFATAESFRRSQRLRAEGMCPNGHGPMLRLDDEGYEAGCPVCTFTDSGNTPRFAGLPARDGEK